MAGRANHSRRDFLLTGTAMGSGLLLAGFSRIAAAADNPGDEQRKDTPEAEEEISPAEDLMREHGVLIRILLIYDEFTRRLTRNAELPIDALTGAIKIIRNFIEDYHSKLEEDHIFPLFEKAGKLVDLVKVLREQHQAGRQLTDQIQQAATSGGIGNEENSQKVHRALRAFIRMYVPHTAREDTVVFPAIRGLLSPKDYDALGEKFENREHELFGRQGFEKVVEQVTGIEKTLDLDNLSRFTARIES